MKKPSDEPNHLLEDDLRYMMNTSMAVFGNSKNREKWGDSV